ncbi:tyrosine-type recombinase/integrase [Gilliamella sp. Occ4-3]|jgi:integrase|uniref:tyrosine-type recombinase/integrase n=1 Tax=Gilliamella sp. Occ4-3 TaxID=3120254 RepID=UPI00080DAD8A|nr:integrase arm-type DNA-binding domain-containing protein [Gilliamella apicola]OCG77220.1 integrase [Gilliamella apicola]
MSLTDLKIKSAKPHDKQYKLSDSDGLFLLVHANGSKYWRFRYYFNAKEKLMSLGQYPNVLLSEARRLRDEAKSLLARNIDPQVEKKAKQFEDEIQVTFEQVARKWCTNNKTWSEPHRAKVLRTLELYLFPKIGAYSISALTTRQLIVPIKAVEEQGRFEVANRLQQRTSAIMRYAVQNGYISYNPAQDLKGVVSKVKVNHRPALELEQIPELLERIDNFKGRELTKLAIKLSLLIFIRSSELRFARWSEIDFDKKIWTIPAEREEIDGVPHSHRGSKMKTPHLVPLSDQAIDVLKQIHEISGMYELVFIGDHSARKPMSENTVNKALRTMGYDTKTELCGHGFRTMACSALVESNLWSRDAVERQMSHQERNGVRAAYIHKAQHIIERTKMVQWWADYLDSIRTEFIMPYEFKTN